MQGVVGHLHRSRGQPNETYLDAYLFNHTPVPLDPTRRRQCERCGKPPTATGHDPCIADLPGVLAACCGHGGAGYVFFDDEVDGRGLPVGRCLRFYNQTGDTIREMMEPCRDTGRCPLPSGWAWDQESEPGESAVSQKLRNS